MPDRRIRIAKDKGDLVKELLIDEDGKGLFKYQVDVLAFAAVLGANRNHRVPLGETMRDPIRQDIFIRQGYDTLFNLLAVFDTNDPKVLADTDEMDDRRATIFEEFANGGLEILKEEVKGSLDYLDAILLMIAEQRRKLKGEEEELDIGKILE
jgi:dnd system-associated protein 4